MADRPKVLEPHTPHSPDRPHVIVRGEGVSVWDECGTKFLDGVSGLWCVSLGYSEKRLIDAATAQLGRLPFYGSFNHRTNDVAIALADDLAALSPMPDTRVFFANSGSEANDSAIKLAWYYHSARGEKHRTVILSHHRSYHGSTAAAASASSLHHMHEGFGPLPLEMFGRLACPDPLSPLADGCSEAEFIDRLIDGARHTIEQIGAHNVAAVIAEPVLGAGGLVIPPHDYLRRLKTLLARYGILLILDEIITGFGRTGRMFGAEHFSVTPDLISVAKGLSSAYMPISAVLVAGHVCDAIDEQSERLGTLGHGFTYSGHPVSAAVARETLRILEERDLVSHVRETVGPHLASQIAELDCLPAVRHVRTLGLLAGVQIEPGNPSRSNSALIANRALEHGLIVRAIGDTIILAPPLVSTQQELSSMVDRLGAALTATIPGQLSAVFPVLSGDQAPTDHDGAPQ